MPPDKKKKTCPEAKKGKKKPPKMSTSSGSFDLDDLFKRQESLAISDKTRLQKELAEAETEREKEEIKRKLKTVTERRKRVAVRIEDADLLESTDESLGEEGSKKVTEKVSEKAKTLLDKSTSKDEEDYNKRKAQAIGLLSANWINIANQSISDNQEYLLDIARTLIGVGTEGRAAAKDLIDNLLDHLKRQDEYLDLAFIYELEGMQTFLNECQTNLDKPDDQEPDEDWQDFSSLTD